MLDTAMFMWSENFRVGHVGIDQGHQAILFHLRALQRRRAGPCDVSQTLEEVVALCDLCSAHFAIEEDLMQKFTEPVPLVHRDIHRERHGDVLSLLAEVIAHLKGAAARVNLFTALDRLTEGLLMDITWLDFEMLTHTTLDVIAEPDAVITFPKARSRP